MIPDMPNKQLSQFSFPRVSGDDPSQHQRRAATTAFSPRERG